MPTKAIARAGAGHSIQPDARRYTLYTVLIATGMMLAVYGCLGVWPLGDGTVLTGDLNAQYINYFAHFRRAVLDGSNLAYTFEKGLGGGLAGLFAYYVSSPLNLLYLLVPVRWFGAMAGFVQLVKVVLACAFFRLYLGRRYPALGWAGVALALGYGFMAYSFAYAQNIMWHDVLVLMPLVLLGLDRLLEGRSVVPYTAALALAIFANFYIAFMACIFLVLYFAWSLYLRAQGGQPVRARALVRPALRFGGASLLAAGLNAALLLPVLANLNQSKGDLLGFQFSLETLFNPAHLLQRLGWGSFTVTDVQGSAHLPFIYCGVLALALVGCYFLSRAVRLGEKLFSAGILALFLLSFWVKGLDSLWHGLKAPVWFPARYSWLFCLFLLLLAARALALGAVRTKPLLATAGGFAGLYLLLVVFPVSTSRSRILLTAAALLAVCACLWLVAQKRGRLKNLATLALVALVAVELASNGYYIANQFEKYPNSTYQQFVDDGNATLDTLREADAGPWRLAEGRFRSLNDAMLLGYWGVGHFGSTQDAVAQLALNGLGYNNYSGAGPYLHGSTAFGDMVLGLKYFTAGGDIAPPAHWQALDAGAPLPTWQNPWAAPLVFAVNMHPGAAGWDTADTIASQNALYATLGGTGKILEAAPAVLRDADGSLRETSGELRPGCSYEVTAPADGYYYAFLDTGDLLMPLAVNGGPEEAYPHPLYAGALDLGYLQAGQTATVALGGEQAFTVSRFRAAFIQTEKLDALAATLQAGAGDFEIADGWVFGQVRALEGQTLYTAIAWDEGWRAEVNGQAVTPTQLPCGLMALPLQAGENTVKLWYVAPGSGAAGWVISGLCLLALLGVALWPRVIRRNAFGRKSR